MDCHPFPIDRNPIVNVSLRASVVNFVDSRCWNCYSEALEVARVSRCSTNSRYSAAFGLAEADADFDALPALTVSAFSLPSNVHGVCGCSRLYLANP